MTVFLKRQSSDALGASSVPFVITYESQVAGDAGAMILWTDFSMPSG